MAILRVLEHPHPILSQKALPICQIDRKVCRLVRDMIETMYQEDGVGLAAPQVGVSKQIMVISPTRRRGKEEVLYNLQVVERSREHETEVEGCLSLPGFAGEIERAKKITYTALDAKGHPVTETAEGFHARVIQHELDHLNGILILTYRALGQRQLKTSQRSSEIKP